MFVDHKKPICNDDLELVKCYNEDKIEISPRLRASIFGNIWHGVVSIWVVDSQGRFCCSRRSDKLSTNAGKWQPCFGGHVSAGETAFQAASRELFEEAGLQQERENFVQISEWKSLKEKRFYFGFIFLLDKSRKILQGDGEISAYSWLTYEQYRASLSARPESWCAECTENDYRLISNWLRQKLNLF